MTDFEGYTHAQLHAMIESLDPAKVQALGAKLTEAAKTIETIGTKLKDHKVKGWEGEGATAFQNWVSQAGSATLQLAKYSTAGGKYMAEAAQVMREVKPSKEGTGNFPPYDAAADAKLRENLATSREYHNDPDAVQLGQEAWSKLSGDHARAVDAMNKLAGAYDQSALQMGKAEIPTFPPPPDVLVPPDRYGEQDLARSGGGATSAGSSYTSSSSDIGSRSNEPGSMSGHQPKPDNTVPVSVPRTPDRDVDVNLDTVATLPPSSTPPVTTTPGLPSTTNPVGPAPGPFALPVSVPPIGGLKGGSGPFATGPGIGPYPGTGGPGLPGGKVVGTPGMPPRDAGITGGRPVTSTGPSSGIPRGTVIGEGSQAGRPMGGGLGHGAGGPYGGSQVGSPVGRRLASEPGGMVGGRQAGAAGRSIAAGQPFTQGGSGLVRNGVGPVGHAGTQTPGRRRDNQGSERPDYLAEDEETWQGNRRVVPPVID